MQVGSIASLIGCDSMIQPCASASSDDAPLAELLRLQKRVCKRGLMRPAIPAPPDDVLQRAIKGEADAEAQWQLGLLYKDYRNDEYVAETWFKKSVSNCEKRTDATAYRFLYGMYSQGEGVEVNMEKAKEYALKYIARCKEENTQPLWGDFSPEVRDYVIEKIGF